MRWLPTCLSLKKKEKAVTIHQHIPFQLLTRPLAVNSKDMRVILNGQSEIDDDENMTVNITGKEDNSISSSKGGQDEPATISSDEGLRTISHICFA